MKYQYTNQTQIEATAKDQAWAVAELIQSDMDIDEAVEAQAEGWMNDPYDEGQYDAPYDMAQIKPAIKEATIEYLENE